MDVKKIKEKVDLLKLANNLPYCLIPELAKELHVTKSDLTAFVLSSPNLFYVENCWSYREVKVKKRLWPNDPTSVYVDTEMRKNRNLGLGILQAYLKPEDNWRTDEWLTAQIQLNEKYIYI